MTEILVSSRNEDHPQKLTAKFVDGRFAEVRQVFLEVETGSRRQLVLSDMDDAGALPLRWNLDAVRRLPDHPAEGGITLTNVEQPLARLYIEDTSVGADLKALAPHLDRRQPVRGYRRVTGWGLGALASVFLIIFGLVPLLANQLATVLPARGEKALGDATLEQVRQAFGEESFVGLEICDNPDGRAAMDRIQDRIVGDVALPYELTVTVLDHDLINAFALPGGHIVFFRGLIDAADHPDEVAAVFAHELGHVVARDPVRIALRSAGSIGVLGLLLGDFAGGAVVLFLTERLIQASYTREAEAAADMFAHARLIDAGVRPDSLATLFETLREEYGDTPDILEHFQSHPALGDRIAAARQASDTAGVEFSRSLGKTDWRALKSICD